MLKQTLEADLKEAMKAGNDVVRSTLRMLLSAVRNKEIEIRKKDIGLSDEEVIETINTEVKRRRDAIEGFQKGSRPELAAAEEAELLVLQKYLPPELADEELARVVQNGIRETNAKSEKDFSAVMKAIMPVLKGKASGDRISAIVKRELSGNA
ncbi:MAG: hypothetical protein A3C84_04055 [Candidatus Ryanbacteria bacterium RIFCSPHIGHO2_02_FULL_48_12]|uniref:Aspartyl-tRNA amidotransferase n=1 Tax=Candidatus Ryanbacteria bacterium RIFCSPHIGHO2_01_FULL_48_27 TaxID=1802115 RepID=A0A1G2G6R0_9BACT|nr:MAG: hypothetical protein A2756_00900 [Candidatus Ryanbacteria bacterium RIFCSPHIGHO2_01_FULL_48_27]OGZ48544.1 MAG: hypothetical protein A3C84_04055 [Candidatus Ryanbacteria bacterium RIFCSPHIGHO2_02_FULL_48_12]